MPTIPHTEDLTQRYNIKRQDGLVVASYADKDEAFEAWLEAPGGYEAEDIHERYAIA
jgi:hypothetical protein